MADDEQSDPGLAELPADFGNGNIDIPTFEQILEMDDDDRSFSRGIVFGFFEQVEGTFRQMEENLKSRNLDELSRLGHFLKGSSATLGLTKVKDSCEMIQHWGSHKDNDGATDLPDDEVCLTRIKDRLVQVKKEYGDVNKILTKFFDEQS